MPLIKRKITVENDSTTYSKDLVDHIFYVPKNKMLPGDVEVEPVSNDQLAELAQMYPKEYGDKAKAAGVEPGTGSGRLGKLLSMNAKELARAIGEMAQETDEEILWALYEAETAEDAEEGDGTGKNRQTVLEALSAKGIKGD